MEDQLQHLHITSNRGGRPPGTFKDPELEIVKERAAWISRLRKSGLLMDTVLANFRKDLDSAGLGRDAQQEIMNTLKDMIQVQLKAIQSCQALSEKGTAPPVSEPLDLK